MGASILIILCIFVSQLNSKLSTDVLCLLFVDKFDSLQSLDTSRMNCRIMVRVTRIWPSMSTDGNYFTGMNMLFLDSQVSQFIQAVDYFVKSYKHVFKMSLSFCTSICRITKSMHLQTLYLGMFSNILSQKERFMISLILNKWRLLEILGLFQVVLR